MFCETMIRSAALPVSSDPSVFSRRPANAAPSVYASTACATVSRCEGTKPPSGVPSFVCRVTVVCTPSQGFSVTTGQSLPKQMCPPESRMLFQTQARDARSGPMFRAQTFSVSSFG